MNNINTNQITDPNVQQPFLGPSLAFLQDATKEALSNVIIGLIGSTYDGTKVYILWGCVLTGVSTGSGAYSVTAGAVFYNGEIYTVDAVSGTLSSQTLYSAEVTTNPSPDPVEFSDGSSKSVHDVRKWVISAGSSGSNAYSTWINLFDGWTNVQSGVGYQNSWADVGGGEPLGKYKRDGRYALLGGTCGNGASGTVAFTLPVGLRPARLAWFTLAVPSDVTKNAMAVITTNGNVTISYSSGSTEISLEGVRVSLD